MSTLLRPRLLWPPVLTVLSTSSSVSAPFNSSSPFSLISFSSHLNGALWKLIVDVLTLSDDQIEKAVKSGQNKPSGDHH